MLVLVYTQIAHIWQRCRIYKGLKQNVSHKALSHTTVLWTEKRLLSPSDSDNPASFPNDRVTPTCRDQVTFSSLAQSRDCHWSIYIYIYIYISSSLGSRCVPWLGEGLSMSSPNDPVLCCPLPYRVAPVFVQVVSPPLGWSPLTSFLVIWSPSGDARGPSVVFEAVDMPCPGPFHFSHSVDYIYEFCPLPNPDVGPSIFVCDVEHTSFHFGQTKNIYIYMCLQHARVTSRLRGNATKQCTCAACVIHLCTICHI